MEAGDIVDAPSLRGWLIDLLAFGAPRSDAILFAAAFRAVQAADWPELMEINALAVALTASAERRLETTAQGAAFVARRSRGLGLRGFAAVRGGARRERRLSGRGRRGGERACSAA